MEARVCVFVTERPTDFDFDHSKTNSNILLMGQVRICIVSGIARPVIESSGQSRDSGGRAIVP